MTHATVKSNENATKNIADEAKSSVTLVKLLF